MSGFATGMFLEDLRGRFPLLIPLVISFGYYTSPFSWPNFLANFLAHFVGNLSRPI